MVARSILLSVALLAGCGSRTGLGDGERGPRPRDAGPGLDANFDTFPCRWSFGERVLVTSAPGPLGPSLPAAVHGALDEAVGLVSNVDRRQGAIVSLPFPASRIQPLTGVSIEWNQLFTAPDGYVTFEWHGAGRTDCDLRFRDRSFVEAGLLHLADGRFCGASQALPDRLDVTIGDERGATVFDVDLRARTARSERVPFGPVLQVVRTLSGGHMLLYELPTGGGGLAFLSATGEIVRDDDAYRESTVVLLPDSLRGGALVLHHDGEWRIDLHDESLRRGRIGGFGSEILLGSPVTNETEVIVMSARPALLWQPLSGTPVRSVDLPEVEIRAAQVVLRPGTSAGGVFYIIGDDVWFRALVCNR